MATRTSPELPRARVCAVARSGRGGGIDDAGDGGRAKRVARRLPLFVAPTAALKARRPQVP
eukprot:2256184-Alexandrium_andersonii.AAC.1